MLFRLLTAAVVASTALLAQIGTSTITGRVTDPTGAVIPAVKLLVIAKDTNFQYTASTNQEGLFRVQSLQPGPYQVIFEASGFKRVVRDNIDLRTGDVLPVNATLELGDTSESIEVTASAPLLETETSATGTVAEGQFLYSLPMFQRFTNSTLHLVPGMTAGGYTWGETLGGFHIAGQRGTVGFFNDGVNGQDQGSGTNTVKVVQNSIAEIKVLTTALPAEYGHSAGGVVSVVTKTGTNDLHGLASLYGRTRRMQHRRFFDMYRNSQPRPGAPHGQQSFTIHPDFNLGGPVFLPKIYDGRNKTFFFISYQKYIEKMKSEQYYGTVPNDDMKNGIFTFGGVGQALYDPATTRQLPDGTWTRDPIPGNIIPKSRFDPVAVKVLELDPWQSPNLPGSFGSNGPVNNFMWAEYARSFKPDFSIRLDHQFTPAVKLNGGLTYNANAGLGRPGTIRLNEFDGSQGGKNPWRSFSYTAGSTWIVSPTIINDFRAGYYRRRNWREIPSWGTDWGQTLGIPNIPVNMMPSLSTGYGFSIDGPNQTIGETISFRDDLTVVQGTHAFKLGYELMNLRRNQWNVYRPAGTFSFDSAWGLQPTGNPMPRTGNTFAGFLLGYVQQAEFTQALASYLPRSSIHSFYFQDDWKATPTLTLNLGVRYTNESPFNTKWGQMSNFDPAAVDELTGRPGGIIHPGKPLNVRDNNNFQPRVGVAWHPFEKWVFRGGFGVNTIDVKFPGGQFDDYRAQANQQQKPGDPRPLYPISRGPDPIVYPIRPNGTSPYVGTNFGSRSTTRYDPALRNPYALNWNLSTQYEFTSNYLVEIMYQGSAGVGLIETTPINILPVDYAADDPALRKKVYAAPQDYRPFPHFGTINLRSNLGHSTYHSGTVKLEKRYSKGINFLTFYTFSKNLDSGASVAPLQNRSLGKGRTDYDRNHRFVASVTYELPFGRGKKWLNRGGIWNLLFGGYQVVCIQTLESGNPLTFSFSNSPHDYYPTWFGPRRPNIVGDPSMRDNWRDFGGDRFNVANMNSVFDINAFAYPEAFTIGNAGRNIVSGPGLRWTQVSAQKEIPIKERLRAEIRWDMNNALKTYNFTNPSTAVDLVNPQYFGKISDESRLASMGGGPVMHLTIRLSF